MGGGLEGVSGMANCSLMRRRSCAATGCPCIEAALADASAVAMVAMAALALCAWFACKSCVARKEVNTTNPAHPSRSAMLLGGDDSAPSSHNPSRSASPFRSPPSPPPYNAVDEEGYAADREGLK
tara:strand:- start:2395 stop:2769 length:375 start_codon:yes stop_codon:yes gene_type:complete